MREIITIFLFHKSYIQNGPQPVRPPGLHPFPPGLCVRVVASRGASTSRSGSVQECGPGGQSTGVLNLLRACPALCPRSPSACTPIPEGLPAVLLHVVLGAFALEGGDEES